MWQGLGSGTSMSQNSSKRRCKLRGLKPVLPASDFRVALVVTYSMNLANAAALVMSQRCRVDEAPQVAHRHRVRLTDVVPFLIIVLPHTLQRGLFFGIV